MTNLVLIASSFSRSITHGVRNIDNTWTAVAVIFTLIAINEPAQASASFEFTLKALIGIAPFLLGAIAIAAYAMASGADGLIAKVFEGHITTMIIFAALFGALSPFCSCGVIPLIAALLAAGVPIPAVIAFWLSSPLIDPGKFILAISTLGIEFTLGLTAAAIAMGLYGGFLTRLVMVHGAFKNALKPRAGAGCCVVNTVTKSKDVIWNFWFSSERRAVFTTGSIATALFLLKWLTLAFLLESLMLRYVPAETVATLLGNNSNLAIPIAALTGIPVYLNGYAALPLVQGLIKMGVVPGAGLAFLVAGAVTSIPAAIAVFAIVRISIFTWYVALALTGATLAGLLFQLYLG